MWPFHLRVCASRHIHGVISSASQSCIELAARTEGRLLRMDHCTGRRFAMFSKVGDVSCFNNLRRGVLHELGQCQQFSRACASDSPGGFKDPPEQGRPPQSMPWPTS